MEQSRTLLERLRTNNYLTDREKREYLRVIEKDLIDYEIIKRNLKSQNKFLDLGGGDVIISITPKKIKFSDIFNRLKEEFKDYKFEYGKYDCQDISVWKKNWCYAVIRIEEDKLILDNKDKFSYPKWLYSLWLYETEVVNDMEE